MVPKSLSSRLLAALVPAQACAIVVAMLAFPLIVPFDSYTDIAEDTFRAKILQAIEQNRSGRLAIVRTPDLERYVAARPGAAFAVVTLPGGEVLPGSDKAIGDALSRLGPFGPRLGGDLIADYGAGGTLIVTPEETPVGRLMIGTIGNAFHAEDWTSLVKAFVPVFLPIYGPVIFGGLVLIPLIVRLVTRPLRRLASEAAKVSPGRLDLRFDEEGLGVELQSLVRAVNTGLARIEEGFARQRIYAANAAHELRTPISVLGLRVDQLSASALKARLQLDVARIQTLVEQLVSVARLGQSHVSMNESVDIVQLLRDVVADRAPVAHRGGQEIELDSTPVTWAFLGNRQALFSALANVVDNAIRAEPSKGVVIVRLTKDGIVEIEDHGAGVRPEDRAMVFEPFWRGPMTEPGAGLGLAIVKEIAERHQVAVSVADTAGGGATFNFDFRKATLPVGLDAQKPAQAAQAGDPLRFARTH
jgi:two-component system, OmpR family, sensor kinase